MLGARAQPDPLEQLAGPLRGAAGARSVRRQRHLDVLRAVRVGIRLNCWKTNPMRSGAAPPARRRRATQRSRPSKRTSPELGRSSPPSSCSRVDLPDPLGPATTTNSPRSIVRSTPSQGRRPAPRPGRSVLVDPVELVERHAAAYVVLRIVGRLLRRWVELLDAAQRLGRAQACGAQAARPRRRSGRRAAARRDREQRSGRDVDRRAQRRRCSSRRRPGPGRSRPAAAGPPPGPPLRPPRRRSPSGWARRR